jgi:hypothetical protein
MAPYAGTRTCVMKPSLIMIQFLSWVADRPRSYTETMEAWRTTCAKFSPWEDAVIEGLVRVEDRAVWRSYNLRNFENPKRS